MALLCCTPYANAGLPNSMTLQPSDDADGENTPGGWSLFVPQDAILMVRKPAPGSPDYEYRAAMEFDITALPVGAVVNSATLKLMSADLNAMIGVHGYAGDGVVAAADLAVENLIVSFDHNPGLNQVDVTGFV